MTLKRLPARTSRRTPGGLNRNDVGRRHSPGDFVKRMLNGIPLQTTSGDRCSALCRLCPPPVPPQQVLSVSTVVGDHFPPGLQLQEQRLAGRAPVRPVVTAPKKRVLRTYCVPHPEPLAEITARERDTWERQFPLLVV